MDLCNFFPFWDQLNAEQQNALSQAAHRRTVTHGTLVHNGSADCLGLLLVRSGQLRAYICSDEGREITVYRLFERDICLFSASCMMRSIQFELFIEAEKDTDLWVIPPDVFKRVMEASAPVANYVNQLMATRLSEVMWLIEQVMWKSFDSRLAAFLLEERAVEGSDRLKLTHERIANHLGSAREVVTRMLRYFQSEQMVQLSRGTVTLLDCRRLEQIAQSQ